MINMDIFKDNDDDDDHNLNGSEVFLLILLVSALAVIVLGLLTIGCAIFIPVFIGITLIGIVLEGIGTFLKKVAQFFCRKREGEKENVRCQD